MRKRSKVVAAVVVAAALILSLEACVSTAGSTGSVSGLGVQLPAKDSTATINIWTYLVPSSTQFLADGQKALAKEFPKVKVNVTYVPYDQMASKLLGTAATGGGPDGVIFDPTSAITLSQAGVLGDMSPFWSKFADASQFPASAVWKDGSKVISAQGYSNTTGLYYNQAILDAVGVKPPTTTAELGDDLKKVTAAGYKGLALTAVPTAESEFVIMPWMFGEGQNYGKWTKSGVTSVFSRFSDWIAKGYIPKDVVGWGSADAFTNFSSGQYAFTQNGNWQLGLAKKLTFPWGVAPIPAGAAGSHSLGGGEGASIGAKTKNAALVWEYFKLSLFTKSAQVSILGQTGSIPVRADTATASEITASPVLTSFSKIVAGTMTRPNTPKIGTDEVAMGKIWNSVAGGVTTPSDAADQVIAQLNNVK